VRVRAQDDAGLYSSFEMTIAASDSGVYPPRILSAPPTQAATGQAYNYAPVAAGSPAFSWSLGKQVGDQLTRAPEGMLVDGVSGLITWTPGKNQAGAVDVTLVVQNDAGSDFQDFTIQVEGGGGEPSCSCGSQRANLPLLLMLLVLFRWARALRARFREPHRPAD
jgi:hypothetical protein